jgi:hypothetical protein
VIVDEVLFRGAPEMLPDTAEVSVPVVRGLWVVDGPGVEPAQTLKIPPIREWLMVADIDMEISPVAVLKPPAALGIAMVIVSVHGVPVTAKGARLVAMAASWTAV